MLPLDWLTTAQAAAVLGLPPRTVQAYCARGTLAATKIGRDWWIAPAALTAFQATRRKPGWPAGRPRKPPLP